jgi:hypothetical protein
MPRSVAYIIARICNINNFYRLSQPQTIPDIKSIRFMYTVCFESYTNRNQWRKKQEHALFVVQRVSILRNKYHQPDIFSGNYVAKGDLKLMSVECGSHSLQSIATQQKSSIGVRCCRRLITNIGFSLYNR